MTTQLQTIITHLQGQINTALPGVPVEFSEEAAFASTAPRAVVILPLAVSPDADCDTMAGQGQQLRFALVLLARGSGAFAAVEGMDAALHPLLKTPPSGCIDVQWQGDEFEFALDAGGVLVAKRSAFLTRFLLPMWQRN